MERNRYRIIWALNVALLLFISFVGLCLYYQTNVDFVKYVPQARESFNLSKDKLDYLRAGKCGTSQWQCMEGKLYPCDILFVKDITLLPQEEIEILEYLSSDKNLPLPFKRLIVRKNYVSGLLLEQNNKILEIIWVSDKSILTIYDNVIDLDNGYYLVIGKISK